MRMRTHVGVDGDQGAVVEAVQEAAGAIRAARVHVRPYRLRHAARIAELRQAMLTPSILCIR
jgi:hypothetical protein